MHERNDQMGLADEDGSHDDDSSFLRDVARVEPKSPPKVLPRGARVGPYAIEELLGRGGMGVVYRARDTRLGRDVALKLLAESTAGDDRRRRFLREARSAAAINHPNVATIFEVGEAEEHVYLAMELIEGKTLRARIAEGALGLVEGVRIATEIARGLAPAHAKGIVHRDLKPENVMITSRGAVKVLDFGLAKLRAPSSGATPDESLANRETETREGVLMGTPAYMAPEQAMGKEVDPRTDVFALGIVTYEMITGVRPALLAGGPAIEDERVAAVVGRCLAASPGERFADAGEVERALVVTVARASEGQALTVREPDGQPSASHAPARQTEAVPPPRRPRAKWAVALVIGLASVALVFFALTRRTAKVPSGIDTSPSVAPSGSSAVAADAVRFVERRLSVNVASNPVTALAVAKDGDRYAYFDKDGLWVAPVTASRSTTGPGAGRRHVVLPSEVLAHLPLFAAFFPDGERLLAGSADTHATWILSLNGAPPIRARNALVFALSPDGTRLAFVESDELKVGSLEEGGPATTLETLPNHQYPAMSWSPDGTRIAVFQTTRLGVSSINVLAADGSARRTIRSSPDLLGPNICNPVWTADNRVAFMERVDRSSTSIFEVTLDPSGAPAGPPQRRWREELTQYGDLAFRAGRFFFIRTDSQLDVYVGRLAPGGKKLEGPPTRLTGSDADDWSAGFMPDGRVLLTSLRDGRPRIYTQSPAARNASLFVDGDVELAALGALENGDVIAFHQTKDETFVARVQEGKQVHDLFPLGVRLDDLTNASKVVVHCSTTAPSRCVMGRRNNDVMTFNGFDPRTGVQSPAFLRREPRTPAKPRFSISSDGTKLYLAGWDDEGKIETVEIPSGEVHATKVPSSFFQAATEMPGGGFLASGMFIRGNTYALARVQADGTHTDVLWGTESLWMNGPAIAPNGRDLAMLVQEFHADVWMLAPIDAN